MQRMSGTTDDFSANLENSWDVMKSLANFGEARKYGGPGVTRTLAPEETISRAKRLMRAVGVTRVGDITGLDRIGIPTFISVRPKDMGPGISYYNGKGVTKADSEAGAMMEAIERYSGERFIGPARIASCRDLRDAREKFVSPDQLIAPRLTSVDDDTPLEWLPGNDLISGSTFLVPLNYVICPYGIRPCQAVTYSSSNGLASGNTIEEATCHAICEVVERDASALACGELYLLPKVIKAMGLPLTDSRSLHHHLINLATIPDSAKIMVEQVRNAGLEIYVRDVTSDIEICSIDCTIIDHRGFDGSTVAHGGTGTHPHSTIALTRAISEAAQSRLSHIQGGREDLADVVQARVPHLDPSHPTEADWQIPFASLTSQENWDIRDDIRQLLTMIVRAGFDRVISVNLTQPSIGIPVVRIIIPGAETWSVFNLHTKRGEFGPRMRQLLQKGVSKCVN